jgi:hypothetical protein
MLYINIVVLIAMLCLFSYFLCGFNGQIAWKSIDMQGLGLALLTDELVVPSNVFASIYFGPETITKYDVTS